MTIDVKATLVFLGQIDRYPREQQLSDCYKAVEELGLPEAGRAIYEHNEFEALLGGLRNNEAVLLPRLDVVAERRGDGVGNRFLNNMIKLTNQTRIIIDAHAGINSHEYVQWYQHIALTRNRLTNSRKPTTDHMSLMGTLRQSGAPPGIVDHWTEYAAKETFERMAQHWRDPRHKNAAEAIKSFPDKELRKASRKTIERIFGNRTT